MKNAKYPEHEKLAKVQEQSQAIGEFLEWLGEQRIMLAKYIDHDVGLKKPEKISRLTPLTNATEALLAQYFKINTVKLEKEKRQMLDGCHDCNKLRRAANDRT